LSYLTLNYHNLEIWATGQSKSLKIAPFSRSPTSFYWRSIVTIELSCIISEIKRDIGQKLQFFTPPAFDTPVRESPHCHNVWYGKAEWCGYPMLKKVWGYV